VADKDGLRQSTALPRRAEVAPEGELGTALAAPEAQYQEWHVGKLNVHNSY
jgi:hypothetical protein